MALTVTRQTVVSYTAFSPLPAEAGGISLLHYLGSRLRRTLSAILPCEARTFLSHLRGSDHLSCFLLLSIISEGDIEMQIKEKHPGPGVKNHTRFAII